MIYHVQKRLGIACILLRPFLSGALFHTSPGTCSQAPSSCLSEPLESSHPLRTLLGQQEEKCLESANEPDADAIIAKVSAASSDDEIFQCLSNDNACNALRLSHSLVHKLLQRFKNDWKSALGVFRWAATRPGYKHKSEAYDTVVDILGKMKKFDQMKALVEEMRQDHLVTISTVAKVMRRLAGAGQWEDAARTFDELGTFGLKKNTESMNLLLDALCKEQRVEQARAVFLELKSHISPDAHTFNIFIHGWCKVNRVDEAHWTIQEMKGHGCRPCVISYSTIVQFYCHQCNFRKVYELLDEMQGQGCPPNAVTYTTIMCSLCKSDEFEEALQIAERMKSVGCKPDTLFYNCLIHTLGRAGRLREAVHVFEVDMPKSSASPNVSTYNSMIAMFCRHGQGQKAFSVLQEMGKKLCRPDVQTYYPLLKLCFKTGNIDSCLGKLLNDMVNKHHLSLDISTYSLLVHGLCRADKCEWAYLLFQEMISRDITPRYQTCCLLLDEVKQKNLSEAVERIEEFMKKV